MSPYRNDSVSGVPDWKGWAKLSLQVGVVRDAYLSVSITASPTPLELRWLVAAEALSTGPCWCHWPLKRLSLCWQRLSFLGNSTLGKTECVSGDLGNALVFSPEEAKELQSEIRAKLRREKFEIFLLKKLPGKYWGAKILWKQLFYMLGYFQQDIRTAFSLCCVEWLRVFFPFSKHVS